MSRPKPPAARPPTPIPISTDSLETLSGTLFAPNLKPPRIQNPPKVPSLAGSKLAPPWAEVDERPAWRVRRFKLWRDNAPCLFLAVLDPRRRAQLKRYQSFPLPNGQAATYGVRAVPVLLNPKPDPTQPIPRRPLVMPRTPYPWNPGAKVPKWDRKARYQRLLQYKYVLDQEHERRFRAGMRHLMANLYSFERDNLIDYDKWGDCPWKADIDHAKATQLTQFFRDIKKKSTNIFHHLRLAHIPIHPVWRREEVHRAVKAEHKRRDKQREKKEAKKAAEQAKQEEDAAAAAAAFAHAEAELFFELVAAGVTEEDRAGELEELEAIRDRIAQTKQEAERAAQLDKLDDVQFQLKKTTEQIAALKLEIARLEAEDDGEGSASDGTDRVKEVAEVVTPKKKRKPKTSQAQTQPDSISDGGLTNASTISTASVRTPKEASSRPPVRSIKTDKPELNGRAKSAARRPALAARRSAPASTTSEGSQDATSAGRGNGAMGEPARKRLTFREDTGAVASHELHDQVAQQLAQMIMAMSGGGPSGPQPQVMRVNTTIPVAPESALGAAHPGLPEPTPSTRRRPAKAQSARRGTDVHDALHDASHKRPSQARKQSRKAYPRSANMVGHASSVEPVISRGDSPASEDGAGVAIASPRPSRQRVSRLVNLDRDHVSPPSSPTRYASPALEQMAPERISITRAPSPVLHPPSSGHSLPQSLGLKSDSYLLDFNLAAEQIIPELLDEMSLSAVSQRPDHLSTLQTTQPASDRSWVYADLNRDEDTAAVGASSAPRSDISRLAITTTDDDDDEEDDSASDESFATVRGEAPAAVWTRGSDAASEPDTQVTVQPLRPRLPVYTS